MALHIHSVSLLDTNPRRTQYPIQEESLSDIDMSMEEETRMQQRKIGTQTVSSQPSYLGFRESHKSPKEAILVSSSLFTMLLPQVPQLPRLINHKSEELQQTRTCIIKLNKLCGTCFGLKDERNEIDSTNPIDWLPVSKFIS